METRPGIKTTEFWVTVFIQVLAMIGAASGKISYDAALFTAGGTGGLYTLSRGHAKNGIKPD